MKKIIAIAIIIAIIAQVAISSAEPAEVKIDSAYKLVEKGENFTINISFDPNGTAIAGAQFNLNFNGSRLNVVTTAAGNSTEGDLFNRNSRSFFNDGLSNNSAGTLINVFSAIIGRYNTTAKGNLTSITMVALTNESDTQILSVVKISTPDGQAVTNNLTFGSVCASPRYDINCVDHKVNIVDLTILNQNFGKTGEAMCPQYEKRCDIDKNNIVNIIDKTLLQQQYGKTILP